MTNEPIHEAYEPLMVGANPMPLRLGFLGMQIAAGKCDFQFSDLDNHQADVTLSYPDMPLLIRMCDESYRLESMKRLAVPSTGSIYKVLRSPLLGWFHQESLGIYQSDGLFHLAIICDEWIDIVSVDLPLVVRQTA